jgi:hypothetical protein
MRPAAQQRIYKLRPQPFKELDTWLQSYRQFWEDSFDRLDDYLTEVQKGEKGREKKQQHAQRTK